MMIEYKGRTIEYNLFNLNEYSVQYCGDECIFFTLEEAKQFIDEVEAMQ